MAPTGILADNGVLLSNLSMMIVLLLVAAALVVLEVCTPSFGILAALSIAVAGVAVYYAFQIGSAMGYAILMACLIGGPAYAIFMVKLLPKTPLGRWLFLKDAVSGENEGTPQAAQLKSLVGKTGLAETTLRPSGAVRVDGLRVDARAEQDMIEEGQTIRVIRAGGTDVVVRAVEEE